MSRAALSMSLLLGVASLACAQTAPAVRLAPAPLKAGDAWSVRTQIDVVEDGPEASRVGDRFSSSSTYGCRVLARDDQGRARLQIRTAKRSMSVVSAGKITRQDLPDRTEVRDDVDVGQFTLGVAELAPACLSTQKPVRVGARWEARRTVLVVGLVPVATTFEYEVVDTELREGRRLLRLRVRGKGDERPTPTTRVGVRVVGSVLLDPARSNQPLSATLVYRFRISDGEGPDRGSKLTARVTTTPAEAKR